uniref:C6 domain-containing protein n=1 Tax=Wuchereria bancrofti TaxID=6293 RepID=A0A1I8EY79_WUCBA
MNNSYLKSAKHEQNDNVVEICRACDNIPGIGAVPLFNGERNGQLAIVYGVDARGCRTANIVCDSRPLIMQTAIIYANGIKTNLLTMSPTGMAQLTLTCDDNIHWKAPKSITNVWNVTCLLRDIPIPTTPLPPVTTPIPCSKCANIRAERVKNPSLTEGDGKLVITYMQNQLGCRVAHILCNTSVEFAEAIIYFNEMKDLPIVSNVNGAAMISLVCTDNLRFRAEGSRVNVGSVTCLSRDIIPTMPPITTKVPVTVPVLTTAKAPLFCADCKNIKTEPILMLNPNEINGALTIEYSRGLDGCRIANIICGDAKKGTTARIYFNEEINLPFISDITGQAKLELLCGSNSRWRAFESRINVASVSCLVIDTTPPVTPIPTTPKPKPPIIVTVPIPTPECQAQWSVWEPWSLCTDVCGAYGSRQRFRGCQRSTENCFCPGSVSDMESCNLQPCLYPRAACRQNYVVSSVNQKFVCVPIQ